MAAEYRVPALVIDEAGALHGKTEVRLWRRGVDAADPLEQVQWGGVLELAPTLQPRAGDTFEGTLWLESPGIEVQGRLAVARLTVREAAVEVEGLGQPPF